MAIDWLYFLLVGLIKVLYVATERVKQGMVSGNTASRFRSRRNGLQFMRSALKIPVKMRGFRVSVTMYFSPSSINMER